MTADSSEGSIRRYAHKYLQLCCHLLVGFPGWSPALWASGSEDETLGPRPLEDSVLCRLTLRESPSVSGPLSCVWRKGCCHSGELARPCVVCHRQGCCGPGERAAAVSQWLGEETPKWWRRRTPSSSVELLMSWLYENHKPDKKQRTSVSDLQGCVMSNSRECGIPASILNTFITIVYYFVKHSNKFKSFYLSFSAVFNECTHPLW